MTDITKYKSVAVKLETYNQAKRLAKKLYMPMNSFFQYLVDKETEMTKQVSMQNGKDHDVRNQT